MADILTLWEQQKYYPTQSFDSWCQQELQKRVDAERTTSLRALETIRVALDELSNSLYSTGTQELCSQWRAANGHCAWHAGFLCDKKPCKNLRVP